MPRKMAVFQGWSFLMCLHSLTYCVGAVVGLESTSYQVPENVGVVEVCARVINPTIMCPIAFPYTIRFSTTNVTAGNTLCKP